MALQDNQSFTEANNRADDGTAFYSMPTVSHPRLTVNSIYDVFVSFPGHWDQWVGGLGTFRVPGLGAIHKLWIIGMDE